MAPSRTSLAALVFAALLVTVALVLLSPWTASAQVTHSGSFSLTSDTPQIAVYKVTQPENVVLTVCVAAGSTAVDVLGDGNPAGFGLVSTQGCKTRRMLGISKITVSMAEVVNNASIGTYSLSVTLP
ncbi:MAG: hypothetical protein ACREK6_12455 [Candidatus Rokuibacteriota bacterium]